MAINGGPSLVNVRPYWLLRNLGSQKMKNHQMGSVINLPATKAQAWRWRSSSRQGVRPERTVEVAVPSAVLLPATTPAGASAPMPAAGTARSPTAGATPVSAAGPPSPAAGARYIFNHTTIH